ncbi:hypothetical protein Ancab_037138 [Ancistrocladus abbreviatus]
MLNPLKFCLASLPTSAKTLLQQLRIFRAGKLFRQFPRFGKGLQSSFAAMEVSNQLEQVFKFIDVNGDGKISPVELSEVLLRLGHDKSKVAEEVQGMVKEMDSNGDGFIDLNEYMSVMLMNDVKDGEGVLHHHHHHHHGCLEHYLMDAFLVFDSDRNGLISAEELKHVLKSLGFDHCSMKECHLMIKGVDRDGDGFVDFEEFRIMMM